MRGLLALGLAVLTLSKTAIAQSDVGYGAAGLTLVSSHLQDFEPPSPIEGGFTLDPALVGDMAFQPRDRRLVPYYSVGISQGLGVDLDQLSEVAIRTGVKWVLAEAFDSRQAGGDGWGWNVGFELEGRRHWPRAYERHEDSITTGGLTYVGQGETSQTSLFGNVKLEFAGHSRLAPYVGVGAGYAWRRDWHMGHADQPVGVLDGQGLVVQVTGGLNFRINQNLDFGIALRLASRPSVNLGAIRGEGSDSWGSSLEFLILQKF